MAQPAKLAVTVSAAAIPFLQKGLAAHQQKQYAQAEQAFKLALSKMGPSDSNQLVALDGLAKVYYNQSQYPQAIVYAQKSNPFLIKRFGVNSIQEADNLFLIASSYHLQKQSLQAEPIYKRVIPIYELLAKSGTDSSNYTNVLQNLGIIKAQQGQYAEAIPFYRKALTTRGKTDLDAARTLENIAISYHHLQQLDQAADYYQQALTAYEQAQGPDSADGKRLSFKVANLRPASVTVSGSANPEEQYNGQYYEAGRKAFIETKNYEDAALQFKLAMDEVLKFYPSEKAFIANLQFLLGQALYLSEDEGEAEPYLEKALAYQEQHGPSDDPMLIQSHTLLGLVNLHQSAYETAESHVQYVLAHSKKGSGSYFSLLSLHAEILCHQGQFKEAQNLYQQALAYYQQSPVSNERAIKGVQYQLALLDKMFQSESQGLSQYFDYSVNGLRRWNNENGSIQILLNSGQTLSNWNSEHMDLVKQAFAEWQGVLGDKIKFRYTDNPGKSDVVVNWSDKPIAETDVDAQMGVHKLNTTRGFFLSSEIIVALAKDGKPRFRQDIYAAVLHEIGHMLGLSHSSNLSDIMSAVIDYSAAGKAWPTLSARDIQAARILYEQKPAVTNPKGMTLAEYREFNELAKPGLDLLKEQRYSQACTILKDAYERYSGDPYINFYYGLSAFRKGNYKEAKAVFEDAAMPESTSVFSVESQLGPIYVELGHQYNKWGKKNKIISAEFYDKGVHCLKLALQKKDLSTEQRAYLAGKLNEGQMRKKPEPVYYYNFDFASYRYNPRF